MSPGSEGQTSPRRAASITVTAADPVPVAKGGAASHTVVPDGQPTGKMVVEMSSYNTGVSAQPASLTFTADNWQTAQTVTVSTAPRRRLGGRTGRHQPPGQRRDDGLGKRQRNRRQRPGGPAGVLPRHRRRQLDENANWLSNQPPREWHGVTINRQVTQLVPGGGNVSGSLPSELGKLDSLTRLAPNRNQLTGAIPLQLDTLSNLSIIGLANNQLSGSVPLSQGNLSGLPRLSLHDNMELSSPLLDGFATNLDNLQRLAVANSGICAPNTVAFRESLDTVPDKPGVVPTCE